jgi:hypothetical protein
VIRYEQRERAYRASEPVEIRCDRCGKDIAHVTGSFGATHAEGCNFFLSFSFGSRHDSGHWQFDVCDGCAEWLREELTRGAEPAQQASTAAEGFGETGQ